MCNRRLTSVTFRNEDSNDLAVQLLGRGLARVDLENLPEDCVHYLAIEAEARRRNVGLWENAPN